MKILSRDFTRKEKVLLLVLAIVLLAIFYYWCVDQPVRTAIAKAEAETAALQTELTVAETKVGQLRKVQSDLDDILASSKVNVMGSYNNSKEELALLNDVLEDTVQYTISFSDVTRNKDQIRRDFALTFTAKDYGDVKAIISRLTGGELRCLIADLRCTAASSKDNDSQVAVSATATFYETMVGGTEDAGLPADKASGN